MAEDKQNLDEKKQVADQVWDWIVASEGEVFKTYKVLDFSYHIKGNEIFVDRKEKSKSIIRSSVEIAVAEALKLKEAGITDYGPKKLKVFGASYLWAILKKYGL